MTKLWFRARTCGWGWTPVSVEGWLVLGLFFAGVAIDIAVFTHRLRGGTDLRSAQVAFLVWLAILVAALIAVCSTAGERPRWHGGD